jgi:four helix bundle protein
LVAGRWSLVAGRWSGTKSAQLVRVKAKNLEDLLVYREAIVAEDAVSALLQRPAFGNDSTLKDQLSRSSSRIAPLIAEGFGQLSDRHFAVYLGRARGSSHETRTHLRKAHSSKFISDGEYAELIMRYTTIGKRLTKLITYLKKSNWPNRR